MGRAAEPARLGPVIRGAREYVLLMIVDLEELALSRSRGRATEAASILVGLGSVLVAPVAAFCLGAWAEDPTVVALAFVLGLAVGGCAIFLGLVAAVDHGGPARSPRARLGIGLGIAGVVVTTVAGVLGALSTPG